MAKLPNLVIDIGNRRIKVLQVRSTKSGVEVLKAGAESLNIPPNADNETFYQKISETLPLLLQRLGIKEKRAIVAIPGKAAFTRQIRIPVVRGRQLGRIIKYEAKQQIPFPLEQVNLDYKVSPADGVIPELEVSLVAVRREVAEGYAQVIKKCGIRPDIIEAAPLSIYNAYASSALRETDEVTAVVSIGASSTDIVIEQNGQMTFMRSATVAGNTLTSMVAKKFEISEEEAETLKTKPADDYTGEGPSAEDVAAVLERGFEMIVTEVRRSFDYYVSQPEAQPVTRMLLTGGTVNIEGVTEFLEDRLGVPVSIFDASENEAITIPAEHKDFLRKESPLVGMAIRAGGKSSLALSFSPPAIKQKLELERRAPLLSAIGLVVIGMVFGAYYFLNQYITVQQRAVAQMEDIVSPGILVEKPLRDARAVQEQFDERFEQINKVVDKRGNLTKIFLEVQRLMPRDIWLNSIEMKSDSMTIVGRALDQESIPAYLQNLSMSPYFETNAVLLMAVNQETDLAAGRTQSEFTIEIRSFVEPTQEEIRFVEQFRSIAETLENPVLIVKIERANQQDPTSEGTLIVGIYDFEEMDERVLFLTKVYSALQAAGDLNVTKIDLRFHDPQSNLINHYIVTTEQVQRYQSQQLTLQDLVQQFDLRTPQPTPKPTQTPTPGKEDGDTGMGGYGGMYGGMYGGGMYGGMYGGGGAAAGG